MRLSNIKNVMMYSIVAIPIGIAVGLVEVVFLRGIQICRVINMFNTKLLTMLLPITGILLILLRKIFNKWSEDVGYGMSYVFDVGNGEKKHIPILLVPFSLIACWLSLLTGASVGKEGMAVQLGATVSNFLTRRFKDEQATKTFIVVGIAAGFAGLFLKPIAAICFALELLVVSEIRFYAMLPAIFASYSSYFIANHFLDDSENYVVNASLTLDTLLILKLVILGIIFGLTGTLFAFLLKRISGFVSNLKFNVYIITFIVSLIIAILIILIGDGRYSGTGSELIYLAFAGPENILPYDFILKMLFTILCLSIGFKGGEVTPLFTVGATLGAVIFKYFGLPYELVVALGYAAVFGAGTNTFFCPIVIGAEIFGLNVIPYFLIVCTTSYFINFGTSIYPKQKHGKYAL